MFFFKLVRNEIPEIPEGKIFNVDSEDLKQPKIIEYTKQGISKKIKFTLTFYKDNDSFQTL